MYRNPSQVFEKNPDCMTKFQGYPWHVIVWLIPTYEKSELSSAFSSVSTHAESWISHEIRMSSPLQWFTTPQIPFLLFGFSMAAYVKTGTKFRFFLCIETHLWFWEKILIVWRNSRDTPDMSLCDSYPLTKNHTEFWIPDGSPMIPEHLPHCSNS